MTKYCTNIINTFTIAYCFKYNEIQFQWKTSFASSLSGFHSIDNSTIRRLTLIFSSRPCVFRRWMVFLWWTILCLFDEILLGLIEGAVGNLKVQLLGNDTFISFWFKNNRHWLSQFRTLAWWQLIIDLDFLQRLFEMVWDCLRLFSFKIQVS